MLGQHNKAFAAETEERLRLEVLRYRDEFPADVRIALSTDSNARRIQGTRRTQLKPGRPS